MRTNLLLPLTAIAVVAGGCRSEAPRPAARALERDLTLVAQTAEVRVASPMETREIRSPNRTVPPARRAARVRPVPRSVKPTVHLTAVAPPTPTPAAAEPADQPANDRELLPGNTVTVIPASTAPSSGPAEVDEASPREGRTMVIRGGGTCRGGGRRPGIGIAAAPRPDFRAVSY